MLERALETVFRHKYQVSQLKELYNEVLHNLYSSQNIIGMMEEVSQVHKILGGNPKGKDLGIGRMVMLEGIFKKLLIVRMTQDKDMIRI
jgi:hypothetical protein